MDDPLVRLIQQLAKLPGIGERTATRLAFHILRCPEEQVESLAKSIVEVKQKLKYCSICLNLTEETPCTICRDERREKRTILVVASSQDLMAIERAGNYHGKYHVLHGLLSPLDGIGPEDLKIQPLLKRLSAEQVEEVILATSPNVEGDATALYLAGLIKPLGTTVTRIASGVPIGGELEYSDGVTIHRAIESRHRM
ncbi:MAG: recombination mediator RecR [Pseudomonadota bacterium]